MTIRPALSLLLLIATGLIGCAGAGGTRTASVPTSLDEAQALAAASGKPLLVDFYTDWCSACALFAADGEADERLIAALDEVVLVKIDAESEGDGQRLAKEFAVHGYPTFIVADARGETIARWWGYADAPSFVDALSAAIDDPTTIAEKAERFDASPSARDAAALASYHLTRNEVEPAISYYERAIALGGGADGAHEYELVLAARIGAATGVVSLERLVAAADDALASVGLDDDRRLDVIDSVIEFSGKDHPEVTARFLERGLEIATTDELAPRRRELSILSALAVERDEQRAVGLKREAMDAGWEDDPEGLNAYAWWCFENEVDLERAEALARRGAELAETDDQRAMVLDTVAEIANLRGDRAEAVALIEQARRLDPDKAYYREQLERFTGAVAGSQPTGTVNPSD